MLKEFKEFALRGNVIDMAVGVIFGTAFGKIVSSVVADLLMPLIGAVTGKVNFTNMYMVIAGPKGPFPTLAAAQEAGAITVNYGNFMGSIFDFLIIAFSLFIFVRTMNRLRRDEETAPTTKKCPYCFTDIPIEATRCPNCTSELK